MLRRRMKRRLLLFACVGVAFANDYAPSLRPTENEVYEPSACPVPFPTGLPTIAPTYAPTPGYAPTTRSPSVLPTPTPTEIGAPPTAILPQTVLPSATPTSMPVTMPTSIPTPAPTILESPVPSTAPTLQPSFVPSSFPTAAPTPLDTGLLENGGGAGTLIMEGVDPLAFNAVSSTLQFVLSGNFFAEEVSSVTLRINGLRANSNLLTFVSSTELSADVELDEGVNEISLKAFDTTGRPLYVEEVVYAGKHSLTVDIVDEEGDPVFLSTTIKLSLSDDPDVFVTKTTTTGSVVFTRLPERTVILDATTETNLVGSAGTLGSADSVELPVSEMNEASEVDNNDLSLGTTEGWVTPDNSSVTVIEHEEGSPQSQVVDRRRLTHTDYDLLVVTLDVYPQTASRTFVARAGTTKVVVRFRFITSEIPGGYFSSLFSDYFCITARSVGLGTTTSVANTMNGLGSESFDEAGATGWFTMTIDTMSDGDVVQVDATVGNAADGIFDSAVVVDFIEEGSQNIELSMKWNPVKGGITVKYMIKKMIEEDATIDVYWATGPTYGSTTSLIKSFQVPAGSVDEGSFSVAGSHLKDNPLSTTHIVAAAGLTEVGALADVAISFGANANEDHVSDTLTDIIKDGLRAAGVSRAVVKNTARSPRDQAHAMFQKLTATKDIEANVQSQLDVYTEAGDAVIQVFQAQVDGLSYSEIIANATDVKTAMFDEIRAQGILTVSRYCANRNVHSMVNIEATETFTADNSAVFQDSVQSRLTNFIDERETNDCFYLLLRDN